MNALWLENPPFFVAASIRLECGSAWMPGLLPWSHTLLQQADYAVGDFPAKASCHWLAGGLRFGR
jgi:hypothetical protein